MILSLAEAAGLFLVFSVDVERQKIVGTQDGKNYIIYVDKHSRYENDFFKKEFDKLLARKYIKVKAAGTIDEVGNIKASILQDVEQ